MTLDAIDRAMQWEGIGQLDPIWVELARRMGASDRPVRRIRVTGLDGRGRRVLASLMGFKRIPDRRIVSLDVSRLISQLGLADEVQLRHLVERIHGPIGNRAAARQEEGKARAALWRRASEKLGARVPRTLSRLRAAGVPGGDIEAHSTMLEVLAGAIYMLPVEPPHPLPMLAWHVCGDPHALDAGTPGGRYLQTAALELTGSLGDEQEPDVIAVRSALRQLGVITDRVSSTTVTVGLRARPDTPLGRLAETAAEAGTVLHICGALLDGPPTRFSPGVWLCVENPCILEAALQENCSRPIVCTSGWPSTDTRRLLEMARSQGIELIHAGDYDHAGLLIADFMATHLQAKVAMTEAMYLCADHTRAPAWDSRQDVPATRWQPELADAIRASRRIVYQEDPAIWRQLLDLDPKFPDPAEKR